MKKNIGLLFTIIFLSTSILSVNYDVFSRPRRRPGRRRTPQVIKKNYAIVARVGKYIIKYKHVTQRIPYWSRKYYNGRLVKYVAYRTKQRKLILSKTLKMETYHGSVSAPNAVEAWNSYTISLRNTGVSYFSCTKIREYNPNSPPR